jgi:hypothetical protein
MPKIPADCVEIVRPEVSALSTSVRFDGKDERRTVRITQAGESVSLACLNCVQLWEPLQIAVFRLLLCTTERMTENMKLTQHFAANRSLAKLSTIKLFDV